MAAQIGRTEAETEWPAWARIVVAVPGFVAAGLLISVSCYTAATRLSRARGLSFALISTICLVAVILGALIATATVFVSLRRAYRTPLVVIAVIAGAGTVHALQRVVSALTAPNDRILYGVLAVVLAYLATVALWRLLWVRRATNAQNTHRPDAPGRYTG